MKILIVEDDLKLSALIARGLREEGHVVESEQDGAAGEAAVRNGDYDVLLVDVMLPKKDGLSMVRDLRAGGTTTPIVVMTARDAAADVVAGLDAGADDYLRKPFDFSELEARLRSVTRRSGARPRLVLEVGDLVFDVAAKRVTRGGRAVELTARELAFLEYFMRNAGIVVTRTMLERALWAGDAEVSSNVIDVYVRRLRSKLEFGDLPPLIQTVRGIGYRLGTT